jgi:hypothetical protein
LAAPASRRSGPRVATLAAVSIFQTPEAAVLADSVPARYVRVVAVEHAPDGRHAVVFVEYNEPPDVEPYQVLCEKVAGGGTEEGGGSGGGTMWMWTRDDPGRGRLGVLTTWDPPTALWDVADVRDDAGVDDGSVGGW